MSRWSHVEGITGLAPFRTTLSVCETRTTHGRACPVNEKSRKRRWPSRRRRRTRRRACPRRLPATCTSSCPCRPSIQRCRLASSAWRATRRSNRSRTAPETGSRSGLRANQPVSPNSRKKPATTSSRGDDASMAWRAWGSVIFARIETKVRWFYVPVCHVRAQDRARVQMVQGVGELAHQA